MSSSPSLSGHFSGLQLRHTTRSVVSPFKSPLSAQTVDSSPSDISRHLDRGSISHSASPSRTVTNAEFESMLEFDPNGPRSSNLGMSLYELSLHLRTIGDVRDRIVTFRTHAPLVNYKYSCLTDLLRCASKCPPDMLYFLLTVGARMVKSGNVAPKKHLKVYIRVCEHLISTRCFFVSFRTDQKTPQDKLRKMLSIFLGELKANRKGKTGKLTTRQIELYLEAKDEVHLSIDGDEASLSVSSKRGSLNYRPTLDIDELASIRLDVDPDHYTQEQQRAVNFIPQLNQGISLAGMKKSMRMFLSSTEDLYGRIRHGKEIFPNLSPQMVRQILKLVSLFASWDVAYDASLAVWEVMQQSDEFNVDALLSQLPVSYGDFLVEALKTFAEASGIQFKNIDNPY